MPPKQKVQLDKAAWSWTETTDHTQVTQEHIHIAYRLNLSPCERGSCKRNCKGNPFCLNNLGEKKWFGQVDESKLQNFNPEHERLQEGDFVGLKNLGATCYVNTFLQLWFHNPIVRRAIYEWRGTEMDEQYVEGWKPDSICGHLQVIFALMQLSRRCYVDPTPLIDCLGLDAGEQQDAQEFSKLFLQVLESALSNNSAEKQNVIDQQFCGRYHYVTVCQNCGSQSETPATFYELDLNIRGHTSLTASIKDFLKKEKLEGDNQYMCSRCNSKQNATRAIELKKLPPVLNLQLLRFVFDKNKGHKKKLSSFIQFPETLDMKPFLGEDVEGLAVYDLVAVLIHSGPTANSGHYIAHIREHKSGVWYKFNDEEIEKMKQWKLELGKEEDVQIASSSSESSSEKAPKASKGVHSSRNAYMLVYALREQSPKGESSTECPNLESLLPATVRGYVDQDNLQFEKWIQQMLEEQKDNITKTKEEYEEMKAIYNALPMTTLADSWEWVSTAWLSTWLAKPANMEKVVNQVPRCPHGKMPADDVIKMKCISGQGAALLFSKFPVDKRYKGSSLLCAVCIRRQCREMRFRRCMSEDDRLFSMTKNIKMNQYNLPMDAGEDYFWVSTKHLRSWKRFAVETISCEESSSSSPAAAQVPPESPPLPSSSSPPPPPSFHQFTATSCCNIISSPTSSLTCLSKNTTTNAKHLDQIKNNHSCLENGNGDRSLSEVDSKLNSNSDLPRREHESSSSLPSEARSWSSSCTTSETTIISSSTPAANQSISSSLPPHIVTENRSPTNSNSSSPLPTQSLPHEMQSNLQTDSCWKTSSSNSCENVSSSLSSRSNNLNVSNGNCEKKTRNDDSKNQYHSVNHNICDGRADELEQCEKAVSSSVCKSKNVSDNEYSDKKNNVSHSCNGRGTSIKHDNEDNDEEGKEKREVNKDSKEDEDEEEEDSNEIFNDEILCSHGNLRIDQSGRRLVKKEVWQRLLYYFPYLQAFTADSPNCPVCLASQQYELDMKQSRKLAGQGQKDLLQDLYHSRNRPKIWDVWGEKRKNAYIVSTNFVEGWRKFVKHSIKLDCILEIVNAPLLCEHGLLLYKAEDMNTLDSATRFTLVWEEEWRILTAYFQYDVEIQVHQDLDDLGRIRLKTNPEVCSTCLHERLKQEEEGKFVFTSQTIYIRKIVDGPSFQQLTKGDDSVGDGKVKGYGYDPEFSAPKHDKLFSEPPEKQVKLDLAIARKSSRHRKTRGEKEVVVSSSMTLKELKIKLFSLFDVPPYDQNLSLDGRILLGDESTLQDLRFYPQCVVFFQADEPNADSAIVHDDYLNVPSRPEEGFKGTNLMGL